MSACTDYDVIVPAETVAFSAEYASRIQEGKVQPGGRLAGELSIAQESNLEIQSGFLLDALINTKKPRIFAESQVYGDGRDWTLDELRILGDISVATDVIIFDDGLHVDPRVHKSPFAGTLIFVPGALLRNDSGNAPADWAEATANDRISQAGYNRLYARRLLPVLRYINRQTTATGETAVVTMPGLGCGQFAGPFQGALGVSLEQALCEILAAHADELPNIRLVYYDPYAECDCSSQQFGHLSFLTRPLTKHPDAKPQLRPPGEYIGSMPVTGCRLFSVVAWDHVSWPGNDFYVGSRSTDDGVKAAATSSMYAITGVEGRYNRETYRYQPPTPFETWESVVQQFGVRLKASQFSVSQVDRASTRGTPGHLI